jgi:hypothetical protein
MAKFVAIEEDGPNKVTFAMVREDGSLVVQARYFGNDGYAGHEEISLLPMGVKKLLELLSVTQPNTACSGLASTSAPVCTCDMEDGIHDWKGNNILDTQRIRK